MLVLLTEHGLFLLYELSMTCSFGYFIVWNIFALFREMQSCKLGEMFNNKRRHAFRQLSLKCLISRTIIDRLLRFSVSCIAKTVTEPHAKFQFFVLFCF